MRLLVVGATGGLGRAVVAAALLRGHQVHALVRDPQRADLPVDVRVVRGDVLDAATLEPAVAECEAVLCVLGTPSPRTQTTLLERGTANLVAVMKGLEVRRLVCVTLLGVGDSRRNTAFGYRQVILRVLAPMVPDKENQEQVVRGSGLEWVLVGPPTFVGFGSRGRPRIVREGDAGRIGLVVRRELAAVVVRAAESNEFVGQAIAVGR